MDKCYASRPHRGNGFFPFLAAFICLLNFASLSAAAIDLSPAEAGKIGHRIWQNECAGTVAGLTSWNAGEDFASLGIGHFIWYPAGRPGPFDESFPKLVSFISSRGAKLPPFLVGEGSLHCPWKSRSEFMLAQASPMMKQLRQFLADTVDLQTQFMVNRLDAALPKMLAETSPSLRDRVRASFERLAASSRGCYALIDYVNFKGEGVLATERYAGQGWGLLQVLEAMSSDANDPVHAFSKGAATVLTRRVHNAPPARNESRWLSGWIRRVNSYSRP